MPIVVVIAAFLSGQGLDRVDPETMQVRLTSAGTFDPVLGDGVAFVMGGSGVPMPPQSYIDAADELYLAPRGFTGDAHGLLTPQLTFLVNMSEAQGAHMLAQAITGQIADGHVDADNPVVVFGYSQSAAMSALTMTELRQLGVSPDDVYFILVGNTANPNGGLLERLDIPSGANIFIPWLNVTTGHPTPDFYPADIYTIEYDGFADFPRYPLNLLADLNALMGMATSHLMYLSLTPDQIADAIPLETTGDTLTNYYMIPSETLPLLDPVRLLPIFGKPLADFLEPSLRVLVNLGYGNLDHGWGDGPANVVVPADFDNLLPPHISLTEVADALGKAVQDGFDAALKDLFDPATYDLASVLDSPLAKLATGLGEVFGVLGVPLGSAAAAEPGPWAAAAESPPLSAIGDVDPSIGGIDPASSPVDLVDAL